MATEINVWLPVLSGLITGGIALMGIYLAHRFTLVREQRAVQEKREAERYFIATELIFLLERFADACMQPAYDEGYYSNGEFKYVSSPRPELDFSGVTGDWRCLPYSLVYRLRELPALIEHSQRLVSDTFENVNDPTDPDEGLFVRRDQSARLGLKAIILALRLRKLCSMPTGTMTTGRFSAWPSLWQVLRMNRQTQWAIAMAHRQQQSANNPPATSAVNFITSREKL
ncbi:hypothetical protein ABF227_002989 [Yersinia ruckeri]